MHPYTQAASGGWAWSDLPGAVPDADDTGGTRGVVSSIEETALAVEALAASSAYALTRQSVTADAMCRGADCLIANTLQGTSLPPSPMGLYFAQLWHHKELHPLIASLSALGRVQTFLRLRS